MPGPKTNKRRGFNYEREIVKDAQSYDLQAERAYASNGRSLGEQDDVDVLITAPPHKIRVQAKRKKSLPAWLKMNDGQDAVFFREDQGKSFALIRADHYLHLLAIARRLHASQNQ